jgi:hypothetical protein
MLIVDRIPVVVSVEAVYESLDVWLVEVPYIAGCLPRLLPKHHELRVDQSEAVYHNLPRIADRVEEDTRLSSMIWRQARCKVTETIQRRTIVSAVGHD